VQLGNETGKLQRETVESKEYHHEDTKHTKIGLTRSH
jgi:hypothetical protein